MAQTYGVLGQTTVASTTLTALFTVTTGEQAVVSGVFVTNRSSTGTTFRISVAENGTTDTLKQYIYYDTAIPGNDVFVSKPVTLGDTDVIRVYAGSATVTFSAWGVRIT